MKRYKFTFFSFFTGFLLVAGSAAFLMTTPVKAQCGSQASSCKNCHETQAQDPVNNDGTDWHSQHAFGDFCYACHAGNNQATDEAAAHVGMVDPLSDIVTNCKTCHMTDYTEKAQIYANTLGVSIGTGGTTNVTPAPQGTPTSPSAVSTPIPQNSSTTLVGTNADIIDYAQRYDQIVLGKSPVNVGNVILIALIAFLLLGGGGFVIYREGLVKVTFGDTRKVEGEYPRDVVDLLPAISGLKPQSRNSLKKILGNPQKTEKVLNLMEAVISDEKEKE